MGYGGFLSHRGTSKSSIFRLGFSIINHPAIGVLFHGNPHIYPLVNKQFAIENGDLEWIYPARK
jgi:hypothetical protein